MRSLEERCVGGVACAKAPRWSAVSLLAGEELAWAAGIRGPCGSQAFTREETEVLCEVLTRGGP